MTELDLSATARRLAERETLLRGLLAHLAGAGPPDEATDFKEVAFRHADIQIRTAQAAQWAHEPGQVRASANRGWRAGPKCRGAMIRFVLLAATMLPAPAIAQAQTLSRGQMLYENHCIACHTTQMHWRDARLARSWEGLNAQVRRWTSASALQWSDEDVMSVSRYLNRAFYGFAEQGDRLGAASPQR